MLEGGHFHIHLMDIRASCILHTFAATEITASGYFDVELPRVHSIKSKTKSVYVDDAHAITEETLVSSSMYLP